MSLSEGFLLLVTWLHGMAAVTWVGGSIVYVVAIRPQQKSYETSEQVHHFMSLGLFRQMVDICIAILIATGVILLFDKLSDSVTGGMYLSVLALKIVLSLWMFAVARSRWGGKESEKKRSHESVRRLGWQLTSRLSGVNLTVMLGVAVFFLADFLRYLFEKDMLIP
jgi:uncharacterized membrane protein